MMVSETVQLLTLDDLAYRTAREHGRRDRDGTRYVDISFDDYVANPVEQCGWYERPQWINENAELTLASSSLWAVRHTPARYLGEHDSEVDSRVWLRSASGLHIMAYDAFPMWRTELNDASVEAARGEYTPGRQRTMQRAAVALELINLRLTSDVPR